MADAKEKMTFHRLEPLVCDADNMLDVLVNMLDQTGLTSTDQELTDRDRELITFAVNVAADMTQKVRAGFYEAWDNERGGDTMGLLGALISRTPAGAA